MPALTTLQQPQMQTKSKGDERKGRVTAKLVIEDLRPTLREQFGTVVTDKLAADRRQDLAMLKILELIVSGRIPKRESENYFVTTCRVIVHGVSDLKTSAATRRTLNKALAEIEGSNGWTTRSADITEMRAWRGKRAISRAVLLLALLEKLIGPVELTGWLQSPNPNLHGRAPADLMRANGWVMLADFIDHMLTGSPT